jgi:hypothetical protein
MMITRASRIGLIAVSVAALAVPAAGQRASAAAAGVPPVPIPQDPGASSVVSFLGHARPARPISGVRFAPQHPFMAANDRSNLHDDAYQSDAGVVPGPLGYHAKVRSTFFAQECASVTFDRRGRLLTVCVGAVNVTARILDPHTLATLATYSLPPRSPSSVPNTFTSFGGGGYFYLDNRDRMVVPTSDGHIDVLAETGTAGAPALTLVRQYDVSSAAAGSSILSVLPDWSGHLWLVTTNGTVAVVDRKSGAVRARRLPGEKIGNSIAVDETGGVFVVSDRALYRFDANSTGKPAITWRAAYDAGTRTKPGQTEFGSGTTPTIIRRRSKHFVAITDNANPRMHVLVYPAGRSGSTHVPLCSAPVFAPRRSDTDNSLIAVGNAIIVENNYGYTGPVQTTPSSPSRVTPTTQPGVARINVDYAHGGCHVVWDNKRVRVPTSVSKASSATGLVYVYEHPAANEVRYKPGVTHLSPEDPWYLTALDARTGRRVWSILTGVGLGYNNNYAPITLGPHGTAYVGVLGGLVAITAR